MIEAECAGPCWRDAPPCLQFDERTLVPGAEHGSISLGDERSQPEDLLVVVERPAQLTDEQMHCADARLVWKLICRRLDSGGWHRQIFTQPRLSAMIAG